ncbi:MAG: outer membrane lipid asymmetry maintenance protein MlaD [Nitrospirota bacterium]
MNRFTTETIVGLFMILGLVSLAYLSIRLGDVRIFGTNAYVVKARFANISGLKEGSGVEIAGVTVGKVESISLDNYEALVKLLIQPGVKLQEDSIAAIRTQGIIGDKYVKILPGGSDEHIRPNGEIIETESAIELEELVSKYIFEKK